MLYNNFSGYLREKYGKPLKKICIDGGFSCPNRDGTCGHGGCIYCSERGSGDHIDAAFGIEEQVRRGLLAASEEDGFIAYFQNFTNTYAPIEILSERYNAALIDERIKILAIGTRPDCISDEIAELIASFKTRVDVWVELGLQTASDKTAEIINRGYPTEVYINAARILNKHGIPFVTHIMIGLPGEGDAELEETVSAFNLSGSWGIKIHSVYVARDTELAGMYERGEYEPIDLETYAERAAYVLTHISPLTVVHRLTGDCPRNMLVAPEWNKDKNAILALIRKKLEERGLRQGSFNMR